jgi:Flp pilus assembly protein TadD
MCFAQRRLSSRLGSASLLVLLALSAAGCSSTSMTDITGSTKGAFGGGSSLFRHTSATASTQTPTTLDGWREVVAREGARYRADPRDADIALRYAEALRKTDQRAQAAAVLEQASLAHPHDRQILGAYGRALADTGNLKQALEVLGRAHTPSQPDWHILSAQGAVLDQLGRHEEARRYYMTALKIVPDEPTVLSNLGLSYALDRNLTKAEQVLRKADAGGSKDPRIKQNLALVVGLEGRFSEAESIARADLPPKEAAENVAYLKQMLADRHDLKPAARAAGRRQKTASAAD